MTYEIRVEESGMILNCEITSGNLDTHSALQEIPKEHLELFKIYVQEQLSNLIDLATLHKKRT